jgi:hypothetical protein
VRGAVGPALFLPLIETEFSLRRTTGRSGLVEVVQPPGVRQTHRPVSVSSIWKKLKKASRKPKLRSLKGKCVYATELFGSTSRELKRSTH